MLLQKIKYDFKHNVYYYDLNHKIITCKLLECRLNYREDDDGLFIPNSFIAESQRVICEFYIL